MLACWNINMWVLPLRPGLTRFKRATNASNRLQLRARLVYFIRKRRSNNNTDIIYCVHPPFFASAGILIPAAKTFCQRQNSDRQSCVAKSGSPLIREIIFKICLAFCTLSPPRVHSYFKFQGWLARLTFCRQINARRKWNRIEWFPDWVSNAPGVQLWIVSPEITSPLWVASSGDYQWATGAE